MFMNEVQYIEYLKEKDKAKSVVYKKLDKYPALGKMPTCPNCEIVLIDTFGKGNFCANCGQRLIWSKE